MGQSFDSSQQRNLDRSTTLPRAEMPGRREAKELGAWLGRAADHDPMYLEGTGGFPSDGASETPQPLPARSMASPDCDLLEPKAGDQRAATLILERNGSRSKQGLPACDPGRLNPH